MKKTVLLLVLTMLTLPVFSLDRKVVLKEAPFIPCVDFNLEVFNPSRLNEQISGVKKGETVHLLAWDKRGQNLLVELNDGSRGYMPALAFIKGGADWTVTEGIYRAASTPSRDELYSSLRYTMALPKTTYKIVGAGFWSITDGGLQPFFMNVIDNRTGGKYTVSNKYDTPSYRNIRFKDSSDAEMAALPEETPLEKTVFFDDGKKHSIGTYIGYSEQEIIAILGEPDARIAASRSSKEQTELFYRNVCYVTTWNKRGTYNRGVVFYLSDGKVMDASIDSYCTVAKSSVKTTPLPAGTYEVAKAEEVKEAKAVPKVKRPRRTLPDINWSEVTPWNFLYHVLHDKVSTNFIVISIVIALMSALFCMLWWLFVKKLLNFGPDELMIAMYLIPVLAFGAYLVYTLWLFSWIYAALIGIYSVFAVGGAVAYNVVSLGFVSRCENCHRFGDYEILERVPTERKLGDEPKPYGKEYLVHTSRNEFNSGAGGGSYSTVTKEYNQKTHLEYFQYYDVVKKCRNCGTKRYETSRELIETLPGPILFISKSERTRHWQEEEVTFQANVSSSGSLYNEREISRRTRSASARDLDYGHTQPDSERYNIYLNRYLNGDKNALNEYYNLFLGEVRLK